MPEGLTLSSFGCVAVLVEGHWAAVALLLLGASLCRRSLWHKALRFVPSSPGHRAGNAKGGGGPDVAAGAGAAASQTLTAFGPAQKRGMDPVLARLPQTEPLCYTSKQLGPD